LNIPNKAETMSSALIPVEHYFNNLYNYCWPHHTTAAAENARRRLTAATGGLYPPSLFNWPMASSEHHPALARFLDQEYQQMQVRHRLVPQMVPF
jgi:hypothetical protein